MPVLNLKLTSIPCVNEFDFIDNIDENCRLQFKQKKEIYFKELFEQSRKTMPAFKNVEKLVEFYNDIKEKSERKAVFDYEMNFYRYIYSAIVKKVKEEQQRKDDLFDVVVDMTAFCIEPFVYEIRKDIDKIHVNIIESYSNKLSTYLKEVQDVDIDNMESFCRSQIPIAFKGMFFDEANITFVLKSSEQSPFCKFFSSPNKGE